MQTIEPGLGHGEDEVFEKWVGVLLSVSGAPVKSSNAQPPSPCPGLGPTGWKLSKFERHGLKPRLGKCAVVDPVKVLFLCVVVVASVSVFVCVRTNILVGDMVNPGTLVFIGTT
jgi:hypothetical protein